MSEQDKAEVRKRLLRYMDDVLDNDLIIHSTKIELLSLAIVKLEALDAPETP